MIENLGITGEISSERIADYSEFAPILLDTYTAITKAKEKHQNNKITKAELEAELLRIKSQLENKDNPNPGILASKKLVDVHTILFGLNNVGTKQNFSDTLVNLIDACKAFDELNKSLDSKAKLHDEIHITELMHALVIAINEHAAFTERLGKSNGAKKINETFENKNADGLVNLLIDAAVLHVNQSFDVMQTKAPVIFTSNTSDPSSMQRPFMARTKSITDKDKPQAMTNSNLSLMLDNLMVLDILQRLCSNITAGSVNIKLHNVVDLSFAIYIKYIPQLDASGLIALYNKLTDFSNQINNNAYILDNSKNILNRINSRYKELTKQDIPVIPRETNIPKL